MEEKKKIALNKTLRMAFGIAVGIIFLVTLVAASRDQGKTLLNSNPVIHLNDENEFSIVQKQDIKNWLLKNRNIDLSKMTLDNLDIKKMEKIAEANPWVSNAEVYLDNQDKLHIDIVQRSPIARVFDKAGNSFYLDSAKMEMPIRYGYTYPTVTFTNVPIYKTVKEGMDLKSKIAYLGNVIASDSFWNAQITQIEVQDDQTFVAVPLLGNQRIILGDTSQIKEKLSNLFAFYKKVSSRIGWNTYDTYDLRFKDQVVASPTLGKTPPKVDNKVLEVQKQDSIPNNSPTIVATVLKQEHTVKEIPHHLEKKKSIPIKVNTPKPKEVKKDNSKQVENSKKKEHEPKYLYKAK